MAKIWDRIVSLLFDEQEITVEEELNQMEDYVEIPKLKPMTQVKEVQVAAFVEKEVSLPSKTIEEKRVEPTPSQDIRVEEKKLVKIDVDTKVVQAQQEESPVLIKKATSSKYQPQDIISPIFGGPKNPSEPIETKVYPESKTRQPLTQIISPMFGTVEVQDAKENLDASILDIGLSDMLVAGQSGEEVQASLFDYLEGFNDNEE